MRLSRAIALTGLLLLGSGLASAEPQNEQAPYKAPIVASLSAREGAATAPARVEAESDHGLSRDAILSSPGGQLTTTAAVFVLAIFLASLASKRS